MTVVFDSGVLISALHFQGVPLDALEAAYLRGSIAFCSEIEFEVHKALLGKFRWMPAKAAEAWAGFTRRAIRIEIKGDLSGICRDPKDDMVLECAATAHAELIVTGDKTC